MTDEIGKMAGAIWRTLEADGEMSSAKLKKEWKAASPLVDWAIGWLAREDKITRTSKKQSTLVSLKGWRTQAMHAA